MILLRYINLIIRKGDYMEHKCLFYDTTLTSFYNKTHCGLCYKEISKEKYVERCQSNQFRKCPYFIELCKKVFADDDEILEKLKGRTD